MSNILCTSLRLIVFATVLAGCATPYDDAAQAQRDMDHIIGVYGPACEHLGFAANTDPWRNCLLQLSIKDARDDTAYYPRYHPYWPYHGRYW